MFGGVIRRGNVTLAISSGGSTPGLVRLLREALDDLLPEDLSAWVLLARTERQQWLRQRTKVADRVPLLAAAISRLYSHDESTASQGVRHVPHLDRLDQLESQSVYILREGYREFRNLAMLWSIGKDSTVLLWLARKAFFGHVPFPLLHIDTGYKIPEMIEAIVTSWSETGH